MTHTAGGVCLFSSCRQESDRKTNLDPRKGRHKGRFLELYWKYIYICHIERCGHSDVEVIDGAGRRMVR